MNVGEMFKRVLGIMDEFSVNGTLRTLTDYNDYRLRANRIMDRVQKDLALVDKISANTQITRFPFQNQLGTYQGFDLQQHYDTDIESVSATGSRTYYFEIDNPATVKIQEETATDTWTDLETVANTSIPTSFTAFKGSITASSTANDIRVLFSGDYPYRIRNTALWTTLWENSSQIPTFKEYVPYSMPSDFLELDRIVYEDGRYYFKQSDYYWENPTTLMLNYYYQGSFTIFYFKSPDDIPSDDTTPTTYDSTNLELSVLGQEVMAYGVASELLMAEANNISLATQLLNIYNVKREELEKKMYVPNQGEVIKEMRGW